MKARKGSPTATTSSITPKLNPELGGEAGFERLSEALQTARPRPDPRFRAQPCRRAFRRQSMVARRAGMGPGLAACGLVRHRLGPAAVPRPRRRAAADHRLVLWAGAGKRRDRAALRRARRQLFGLVFRASAADRAGALQRDPAHHRKEAGADDSARESAFSSSRRATRDCATPIARKRRLQGGVARHRRRRRTSSRAGLQAYRAGPDRAAQILALHHLLERQHYKLGHWRLASSDINYRRFFDVNTLAGLRVEDAGTFDAIHRLVKQTDRRQAGCRACGSITSTACAIPRNISSACAA